MGTSGDRLVSKRRTRVLFWKFRFVETRPNATACVRSMETLDFKAGP